VFETLFFFLENEPSAARTAYSTYDDVIGQLKAGNALDLVFNTTACGSPIEGMPLIVSNDGGTVPQI
jgi:hypothetical protein